MRRAAILLNTLLLAGCEQQLSKEKADLLDGVIFALDGIEDNTTGRYENLGPWKRQVVGQTVEFFRIGRNGIGTSSDDAFGMLSTAVSAVPHPYLDASAGRPRRKTS